MARNFFILLAIALTLRAESLAPEVAQVSHEVVVAGHPQAAEAGLRVLQGGGNAVDAAVAVSLCLGVAEPYASGLGGKIEMLYYEASSKKLYVVDGMDTASATLPVKAFIAQPAHERIEGGPSAAVPGLAAGLYLAQKKWGVSSWDKDVQPAISLAEQGFVIYPKTLQLIKESAARIKKSQEGARIFLPRGKLPELGSRLQNLDLAQTLKHLASEGPDSIYKGVTAEAIVNAVSAAGGYMTLDDLASYHANIVEPVSVPFNGGNLYSTAPVSGGGQLLAVLAAFDKAKWSSPLFHSASSLNRFGHVFLNVYPKFDAATGDDDNVTARFAELLSEKNIESIRSEASRSSEAEQSGADDGKQSTTHFIIVDKARNIVCVTQSLSYHFGCGVVPIGTGIVMNNSLSNFSIKLPGKPNYVMPGKRPKSTIAPTIWLDINRNPKLAIGLPGGARIPTGIAQVILDYTEFHRPLADAIGDSRIHILKTGKKPTLECETGLPASEIQLLKSYGWTVNLTEKIGTGELFGGVNAVEFLPDGSLTGVADLRRSNAVRGD